MEVLRCDHLHQGKLRQNYQGISFILDIQHAHVSFVKTPTICCLHISTVKKKWLETRQTVVNHLSLAVLTKSQWTTKASDQRKGQKDSNTWASHVPT